VLFFFLFIFNFFDVAPQILKEQYSKYEVLLMGEIIKMIFSACVISSDLPKGKSMMNHIKHLTLKSSKMFILAFLYGTMNILSFVALKFISAATFTILAQCKIVTTAAFSALMLRRQYSWAKWRALTQLMLAVLLFSAPVLDEDPEIDKAKAMQNTNSKALALFGTAVVLLEVTLSGFSSIYFEKAIKTDSETLSIWERNFQLALWSFPIYIGFILWNGGGTEGYGGGWSNVATLLSILGAAGGLLVALSIKYTDSIMKTLAVTGSIVLSSFLDHVLLSGPMTTVMIIAAALVILSICNYTFDTSPVEPVLPSSGAILLKEFSRSSIDPSEECEPISIINNDDEVKEK
jgi:UDP-sugar transporter A1/2/3